jgi:hypothetical protein
LEETIEKLKVTKEKNLELHNVISKIDRQEEELQNIIYTKRKTKEEQEKLLLRVHTKII